MKDIKYEVLVGNVGTVYTGYNIITAMAVFEDYVRVVDATVGRAAGEEVVLLQDGEILKNYTPDPLLVLEDQAGRAIMSQRGLTPDFAMAYVQALLNEETVSLIYDGQLVS